MITAKTKTTPMSETQEARDYFEPDRGLLGFGRLHKRKDGTVRFHGCLLADIEIELEMDEAAARDHVE